MHRTAKQSIEALLLRVVDFSLAGVIFIVPLLMGGRHAIGQLALTALAVAAAWAWAARQCLRDDAAWRPAVATPLVLLVAALVALQIIPLPPWLLARLAPRAAEALPLWQAGGKTPGSLGYWSCISLTPAETLGGLVIFLDFALLFLVAVQRIRRVEDVERLLRWCAISAVGMASFGLLQLLAGNGKFFWFYEHPFTGTCGEAKGSFSNRNHFAQFLALGIGPLIWWLQDAMRRRRAGAETHRRADIPVCPVTDRNVCPPAFLSLALGIVLFAGLLSLSRGGITAMALAAAIATAVCYRSASLGRRFIGVLAAAGLLIGVSLTIFGLDRVGNRLEDLSSGSLERLDKTTGRRVIWATAAKAIPDSILLGSGVGSFREVYPMYTGFMGDEGVEFTHAENSYLQNAVETGVVGLGLTLAGLALCAAWCMGGVGRSTPTRLRVCTAAIAGSLAAAAAHALVDFVWYVPACMAIVAILAACALRVRQMSREEGREERGEGRETRFHHSGSRLVSSTVNNRPSAVLLSPRRLAWAAAVVTLACLGAWMIADRIGPAVAQTYWDEYLVARHAADARPSPDQNPLAEAEICRRRIACLENAVRWQPTHASAHLALAEAHRQLFEALQSGSENPMSLAHVRDAALQSRFPSRAALVEWLSRAVGPHWVHLDQALGHIRAALRLCPLEGRAYVYLADLSFLTGADGAVGRAYVEQALRVRPFDGAVLYAAGTEALLAGDHARWLDCMKRAYDSGRRQQAQVIGNLVADWPAENLPALVDEVVREFRPDLQSARFLYVVCARRCPPDQLASLARYRVQTAESEATKLGGADAAKVWIEAQQLHSQLGEDAAALRCIGNALQCDPGNYDVHYQGGLCLLKRGLFAEAEAQARWCLQRTPQNDAVADLLREALKGRLDGQRRTASENGVSARR